MERRRRSSHRVVKSMGAISQWGTLPDKENPTGFARIIMTFCDNLPVLSTVSRL